MWQLPIIRHLLQTSLPQDLHLLMSSLLPHLQTLFRLISALQGVDLSGMVSCRSEITSSLIDNLPRGLFSVTGSSPKDILSCGCADLCLRIFSFIVILSCFFIKSPIFILFLSNSHTSKPGLAPGRASFLRHHLHALAITCRSLGPRTRHRPFH